MNVIYVDGSVILATEIACISGVSYQEVNGRSEYCFYIIPKSACTSLRIYRSFGALNDEARQIVLEMQIKAVNDWTKILEYRNAY